MPAIQGQWIGLNPVTGIDGVWFWLTHAKGLVGVAKTQLPAYTGTETPESYSIVLTNLAQGFCNVTTRLAANDPLLNNPEPGCTVGGPQGRDYTCPIIVVKVTVTSLVPLIFNIEVSNPGS